MVYNNIIQIKIYHMFIDEKYFKYGRPWDHIYQNIKIKQNILLSSIFVFY